MFIYHSLVFMCNLKKRRFVLFKIYIYISTHHAEIQEILHLYRIDYNRECTSLSGWYCEWIHSPLHHLWTTTPQRQASTLSITCSGNYNCFSLLTNNEIWKLKLMCSGGGHLFWWTGAPQYSGCVTVGIWWGYVSDECFLAW